MAEFKAEYDCPQDFDCMGGVITSESSNFIEMLLRISKKQDN